MLSVFLYDMVSICISFKNSYKQDFELQSGCKTCYCRRKTYCCNSHNHDCGLFYKPWLQVPLMSVKFTGLYISTDGCGAGYEPNILLPFMNIMPLVLTLETLVEENCWDSSIFVMTLNNFVLCLNHVSAATKSLVNVGIFETFFC